MSALVLAGLGMASVGAWWGVLITAVVLFGVLECIDSRAYRASQR